MNHQIWSIVLGACAAQCLFLMIVFIVRPTPNKRSWIVLLAMLTIILCTTVSNLWTSSYLYQSTPQVAGFARGMVLLLGPVLYFYVVAVIDPQFRFRPRQLLHFIPYIIALIIIKLERVSVSYATIVESINKLIEGRIPITGVSIFWFVAYFIHLLIYVILGRRKIIQSIKNKEQAYLVPLEQRISWLKKLSLAFILVAGIFVYYTFNLVVNGTGSIIINYIYNMVLALVVYMIGFQAIADNMLLSPGFSIKYKSVPVNEQVQDGLVKKLLDLLETEKIFTDPELNLSALAKKTGTNAHIISQTINQKFNKSFNELMNYYRIEEFKKKVRLNEHQSYSIIGLAYDVGYKSKSAFNGAFKKQTGMTPSDFVKSIEE